VLKGVPSGGTGVEELRREEAIWTLKCEMKWIADGMSTESLAGRTAQKRQQTWESDNTVRHGSHCGRSPQNGLVERPWLQLMCCTVCLLHGHNFR